MSRATSTKSLSRNHDFEQHDYQESSSYFDSIGFCRVFDCMDGWSSILSWKPPENYQVNIPKTQHHVNDQQKKKNRPNSHSQRIDPALFRNPLAEKMVEDAVERSKYNTKSQRHNMKSFGDHKDQYDKNDNLLDQKIAMAARRKRQRQQTQPHQSAISYSRRQHRLLQEQIAKHQQQKDSQQARRQSPLLKFYSRRKTERPQTPFPVPGPLRLNPKVSKQKIVPKRRPGSSAMALVKRRDDSKRQSPPTTYCPPVSTPLVPIGERKAMKEKKRKIPIRWNRKVIPFQPDEYY